MNVIRLHVTAEGQTEQKFVQRILAPHLARFNVFADARCVLTGKNKKAHREYRGGMNNYGTPKRDIQTWMKEDNNADCLFTTMFDLYALPEDFPGFREAQIKTDPYVKISEIENAFQKDIHDPRFIPYIQLHEFESLLLSKPEELDWEYLEHGKQIQNLVTMVGMQNPELINDGSRTAPSKRILKEIPEYDKVTAGVSVAGKIGIEHLCKRCRHFGEWLGKLERLGGSA